MYLGCSKAQYLLGSFSCHNQPLEDYPKTSRRTECRTTATKSLTPEASKPKAACVVAERLHEGWGAFGFPPLHNHLGAEYPSPKRLSFSSMAIPTQLLRSRKHKKPPPPPCERRNSNLTRDKPLVLEPECPALYKPCTNPKTSEGLKVKHL